MAKHDASGRISIAASETLIRVRTRLRERFPVGPGRLIETRTESLRRLVGEMSAGKLDPTTALREMESSINGKR